MRAVLEQDSQAGTVRNHAPERMPLERAVSAYVADMDAIDLDACPADFAGAFRAHRDAWEAMLPYLARHPDLRGEMHALFDLFEAEDHPSRDEFQPLLEAVWSTWRDLEAVLARHGVSTG